MSLLSTNIMAEGMNADINFTIKRDFKQRSDDNLEKLLEGKDKVNTQKSTEGALKQFQQYLRVKKLPNIDEITVQDLPQILFNYYPSLKPIKSDNYSVQTLKCICSGLSRYFRKEKGFDIAKDSQFVHANEMFQAVLVESKKIGKGAKKKYPPITEIDLERIAEYFSHDHMNDPNPKILQQQMIFYIIYFFCWRGRENLYEMQQDTYTVITNPDGSQLVVQNIDEIDKNHGPEDSTETNQGRMYPTGGMFT